MNSIFLSASVPVQGRLGFEDSDPYLIKECVSALMEVILGRFHMVWGGHPAITPMIWEAGKQYGVDYESSVTLYQSRYFTEVFPEENSQFSNVRIVDAVQNSKSASLAAFRNEMLSCTQYKAAVFIGGMEGAIDEYSMIKVGQPNVNIIAFPTTGGAAKVIYEKEQTTEYDLTDALDFSFWFYKLLEVDMLTPRINVHLPA